MATLEYHTPQSRPMISFVVACVLFCLPCGAPFLVLLSFAHWLDEPFGVVTPFDVGIFFGAPVMIAASLIAWVTLARRHRISWPFILAAVVWFALMAYLSVRSLLPYFDEPWNY